MWNLILTVVIISTNRPVTTITTVQFKSLESCKSAAKAWKQEMKISVYSTDQALTSAVCAQE